MNTNVPSYNERMAVARARLATALAPETGPEKSIVTWLGGWDEPTITIVADMVERVGRRAYDRGYTEGRAER